ncbi:hypothetical protein N7474_001522 [Penicillium riverlandense]|uniref:uncharacterized protein n=1 Tax=Penicillium riverlandense TaxID=1903569 RepID=UPI0025471BA6|nr:uncharacterized protein N7474_001522 [Penicillium riverlandense]KAJ5833211.1 hypothetical protein N7474_001522 [Penicillium riverlandense]
MSGSGDDRWRGGPSRQSSQRQNRGGQGGQRGGNAAWSGSGPAQEQHVPVRGFNAAETKSALKRANTMANGKDFFVELRKQVAILQRGGTPAGG